MSAIIIPIILAILTIVTVILAIVWNQWSRYSDGPTAFGFTVGSVLVVLFLISVMIGTSMRYGTTGEALSLETFYRDTLSAYEYSIKATGEIEITNADSGLVDIAYQEQGAAASLRIVELRDKVDWYNRKLRWFNHFNTMWIADGYLADLPKDLRPIELRLEEMDDSAGSEDNGD